MTLLPRSSIVAASICFVCVSFSFLPLRAQPQAGPAEADQRVPHDLQAAHDVARAVLRRDAYLGVPRLVHRAGLDPGRVPGRAPRRDERRP